ncbi:MAG: hypothetical protein AAF682_31170 [Planctomycetota bacterium]
MRAKFRPAKEASSAQPVSRAARQLALAHYVERLIEDGQLKDYAAAASALGLTRARLTQIMTLLLLAPELQERVLSGEMGGSERSLRGAVGEASWEAQSSRLLLGHRRGRASQPAHASDLAIAIAERR